MSCQDVAKEPVNGASDTVVSQEQLFKPAVQDMNTIFEIGLAVRTSMAGTGGSGGPGRIEFDVGPIGEEPIEGEENEVGKDFLFDTALSLSVKVLDGEDAFADLVKLLDAPSAMVNINEVPERIAIWIEQRRTQAKDAVPDFVFEQS